MQYRIMQNSHTQLYFIQKQEPTNSIFFLTKNPWRYVLGDGCLEGPLSFKSLAAVKLRVDKLRDNQILGDDNIIDY